MIIPVASWVISILFILIKGNLLGPLIAKKIDVDLVIIITVFFLSIQRDTGAGIFAFFQGLLIDVLSGGPFGFFAFLYIIVFIVVKLLSYPLDLLSTGGRITVIFIAVLIKNLAMVALLKMLSLEAAFSYNEFMIFILSALCSSFAALFIFSVLETLHNRFSRMESEF